MGTIRVTLTSLNDLDPMGYIDVESSQPIDSAFLVCSDDMEPEIVAGGILLVKKQPVTVKDGQKAIIYDEGNERLTVREVYYRDKGNEVQIGLKTMKPPVTLWHFLADKNDETMTSDYKIVGKVISSLVDLEKVQELLDGMERIDRE